MKKSSSLCEQAALYGVDSLSDAEVLAIAAGLERGRIQSVLSQFQFHELLTHLDALGLSTQEKIRLQSIFAVNQRLTRSQVKSGLLIRTPEDAANVFKAEFQDDRVEVVKVALLNSRNRLIRLETVATGTLNNAYVNPRDLARLALQFNAASVILAHNHPSGDATPSQEDISLTQKAVDALKLLDIKLLDHIIIGLNSFISLRQSGLM
jgi:DNA repair protein RadC